MNSIKISKEWTTSFAKYNSLPIGYHHLSDKNDNLNKSSKYSLTFDRYSLQNVNPIIESDGSEEYDSVFKSYNIRQKLILILLAYGNFWVAACVSLQAPFFPKEAESKGATPTQYGLVFGVYELMIAITSPMFGKLIATVSPVFICEFGLFMSGLSTISFGLLDRSPSGTPFIALSFLIRIIEGISSAAFMTSSYAIMTKEFQGKVATTFSSLQTFFGLGLILGPTLGGLFYQLGGFLTPFVILGVFLLLGGVLAKIILPETIASKGQKSGSFLKFILDWGTILDALAIATSLNFIGFNAATLEPHLRQYNLKPVIIGLIFVIFGVTHAMITPICGMLCQKGFDPRKLCTLGSLICIIGFVFIGPQDFLNTETELWLIIVSLILIGSGMASKLVSAYISAMHDTIHRRGFPDDISTYGLVSAMYFTANSIGAFIGPTLGGLVLETVGYRKGTLVVLIIDILFVLLVLFYIKFRKSSESAQNEENQLTLEK